MDTVWNLLTDYEGLAEVVPNLVSNEVVQLTANGAKIKQIGAAQVLPGLTFKASMVADAMMAASRANNVDGEVVIASPTETGVTAFVEFA